MRFLKQLWKLEDYSKFGQVFFFIVFRNMYSDCHIHTSWILISQAMSRSNRMSTAQGSFSTISQALCSQGITTEYLTALLPSSQRQKGNHTKDFLTYKLSKEEIAEKYGIPIHTSEYTAISAWQCLLTTLSAISYPFVISG